MNNTDNKIADKNILKYITLGALIAIIVACAWMIFANEGKQSVNTTEVVVNISPTEKQFLQMCSGIDAYSETTTLVATANCMGRVGGYIGGHDTTVQLNHLFITSQQPENKFAQLKPLWCIPKTVTDRQAYASVVEYIEANQQEFKLVTSNYNNLQGALMLTTLALRYTYQCN